MAPWLIAIIVVFGILFLYVAIMMVLFALVMRKLIWVRGKDPDNPCFLRFEDYRDELERKPYETFYYGKKIAGFLYKERGRKDFSGFVILSHGLFGTHVQYLIDIDMLCKAGYVVLAYDQYGVGLSEGKNQESLGTGIYVLENVIADVERRNLNDSLPIVLYGHSWGGYCVTGALRKHPEIAKAVSRSGFVSPTKAGLDALRHFCRPFYFLLSPVVYPISWLLIGRRNMRSALKGMKNHSTKCLFIYSLDDEMVFPENALACHFKDHPQENAEFFIRETGGHNSLLTPQSMENYRNLVKDYQEITAIEDPEERKRRSEAFVGSLDRRNQYRLEETVRDRILSFLEKE